MSAGSRRSKRVSWAPEADLRKVRLFRSEDAPAASGLDVQDHLQTKASWLQHSNRVSSGDSAPPGFDGPHLSQKPRKGIPQIPLVKWCSPQKMSLNPTWLVVAGDESEEMNVQNQRQVRTLEAIYPRTSTIPPNPYTSYEAQSSHFDDTLTPLVPITAMEEEDPHPSCSTTLDVPSSKKPNISHSLPTPQVPPAQQLSVKPPLEQSQGSLKPSFKFVPSVEPDVVAAASVAVTAVLSSDKGSLIDRDLLIKILSDPKMIETLMLDSVAPKVAPQNVTPKQIPTAALAQHHVPPAPFIHKPDVSPVIATSCSSNFNQMGSATSLPTTPSFVSHKRSAVSLETVKPVAVATKLNDMSQQNGFAHQQLHLKDISYYKNLIQQHGGEHQEANNKVTEFVDNHNYHRNGLYGNHVDSEKIVRQMDCRPKSCKPCVFFNSPRGCKNGIRCSFLHDAVVPLPVLEHRGPKRIRLDRSIAGRI